MNEIYNKFPGQVDREMITDKIVYLKRYSDLPLLTYRKQLFLMSPMRKYIQSNDYKNSKRIARILLERKVGDLLSVVLYSIEHDKRSILSSVNNGQREFNEEISGLSTRDIIQVISCRTLGVFNPNEDALFAEDMDFTWEEILLVSNNFSRFTYDILNKERYISPNLFEDFDMNKSEQSKTNSRINENSGLFGLNNFMPNSNNDSGSNSIRADLAVFTPSTNIENLPVNSVANSVIDRISIISDLEKTTYECYKEAGNIVQPIYLGEMSYCSNVQLKLTETDSNSNLDMLTSYKPILHILQMSYSYLFAKTCQKLIEKINLTESKIISSLGSNLNIIVLNFKEKLINVPADQMYVIGKTTNNRNNLIVNFNMFNLCLSEVVGDIIKKSNYSGGIDFLNLLINVYAYLSKGSNVMFKFYSSNRGQLWTYKSSIYGPSLIEGMIQSLYENKSVFMINSDLVTFNPKDLDVLRTNINTVKDMIPDDIIKMVDLDEHRNYFISITDIIKKV
jgi:hypothetical protein